ncbi:MAG: CopG family ribbon-helix-helix protein [Promethearchaeota archaeon]
MSPIISFSINENLREFINKLISKNKYENKSKLIRDALLRLMSTIDASEYDGLISTSTRETDKKIVGNVIIVMPNDPQIQRKLIKIENKYLDRIISKNMHFQGENVIISYLIDSYIKEFQNIVVEINGIEEIKNFRYMIIN